MSSAGNTAYNSIGGLEEELPIIPEGGGGVCGGSVEGGSGDWYVVVMRRKGNGKGEGGNGTGGESDEGEGEDSERDKNHPTIRLSRQLLFILRLTWRHL